VELVKKRTLLQLRTPLGEVPKEWLDIIEPKIARPDDTTCWLWIGSMRRTRRAALQHAEQERSLDDAHLQVPDRGTLLGAAEDRLGLPLLHQHELS
jgi:hypothetical protein